MGVWFFGVFFFFFKSLVALTQGMKNRHSVLLGLITVIIRILDFALFRLLLPGSESQERLVSLLVSLISRCLFPIKGLSPPS